LIDLNEMLVLETNLNLKQVSWKIVIKDY